MERSEFFEELGRITRPEGNFGSESKTWKDGTWEEGKKDLFCLFSLESYKTFYYIAIYAIKKDVNIN